MSMLICGLCTIGIIFPAKRRHRAHHARVEDAVIPNDALNTGPLGTRSNHPSDV